MRSLASLLVFGPPLALAVAVGLWLVERGAPRPGFGGRELVPVSPDDPPVILCGGCDEMHTVDDLLDPTTTCACVEAGA